MNKFKVQIKTLNRKYKILRQTPDPAVKIMCKGSASHIRTPEFKVLALARFQLPDNTQFWEVAGTDKLS